MRACFTSVLVWLLASTPLSADPRQGIALGTVRSVDGDVEALRNPTDQKSKEWQKSVEDRGHTIARFKDRYWESHKIHAGAKIFYGDQISTGPQARLVILLDDQIELSISANSSIHLTRGFVKHQKSGVLERWVSLISGIIRAKVEGAKADRPTQFRTRSLALGVRGTEFFLSSRQGLTELVTVEGVVEARQVSDQEHGAFERWQQTANSNIQPESEKQVMRQLQELSASEKSVRLQAGKKIQIAEPMASAEPIGLALVEKPTKARQIVVQNLDQSDHIRLNQIKSQFEPSSNEASSAREVIGPSAVEASVDDPRSHLIALGVVSTGLELDLLDKSRVKFSGLGVGFDYRWRFHPNFDVGGFWVPDLGMVGQSSVLFSDAERAEFSSRIGLGGLRLGAFLPWNQFKFGVALNLMGISNFDFKVLVSGAQTNRQLKTEINPAINLAMDYQHASGYGVLVDLGATKLKIVEPYPSQLRVDTTIDHSIGLLRVGVFRVF